MNNYDMGFERIAKLRAKILKGTAHAHVCDRSLVVPEQYRSRGLRALIHLAKHSEEMAEGIADLSGLAERLTRNLISSGENPTWPW